MKFKTVTRKNIDIPTINDSLSDFKKLVTIYNQIFKPDKSIRLRFNQCEFLRPSAVSFLGGIMSKAITQGIDIRVAWHTMSESIRVNLAQNGFMGAIKGKEIGWEGNSIDFRKDPLLGYDINEILNYLRDEWLGGDKISLDPDLFLLYDKAHLLKQC